MQEIERLIKDIDQIQLEDLSQEERLAIAKLVQVDKLKGEHIMLGKIDRFDVQDKIATFLEQVANSEHTVTQYRSALRHWQKWLIGQGKHLLEISPLLVDRYINYLGTLKISNNTRRARLDPLSSFYSYLARWGDVDTNYFKKAKLPELKNMKPVVVPTGEALNEILSAYQADLTATGTRADKVQAAAVVMIFVIELLAETGLRRAALDQLEINEEGFYRSVTKGDKPVQGYLSESLFAYYKNNREKLKHLKHKSVAKAFERKMKKLYGRPLYSLHDFRHYYACHHYQKHRDIYLLSRMLGHQSIKTTERYLISLGFNVR